MQTFLPYPDFAQSAACLDRQRLGKQRVEVMQILKALSGGSSKGWVNHPATKMWRGFEESLISYGVHICKEWKRRGYRDTCEGKTLAFSNGNDIVHPPWLGDDNFHAAHRSNLLRKDATHYSQFNWSESSDLEYVWPV
jgi:hypothetical protein